MNAYIGTVQRIFFHNDENDYTIFQLRTESREEITIKGFCPELHCGMQMTITGEYKTHPEYGRYLSPYSCEINMPTRRYDTKTCQNMPICVIDKRT